MTEAMTNTPEMGPDILSLATEIVIAFVGNNHVQTNEIPALISTTHGALMSLISTGPATGDVQTAKQEPAVSIRASVKPDFLICLEDGKKVTMLKRYLRTNFDLTPEQYRAKWGLPAEYPMVAPNYSETRRTLAKSIGLGTKGRTAAIAAAAALTDVSAKNVESETNDKPSAEAPSKRRGGRKPGTPNKPKAVEAEAATA